MAAAAAAALPATEFLRLHGAQLEAIGFPPSLLPRLQQKLAADVFDAGAAFQIVEDEDGRRHLVATRALAADSDVFLIDHFYSFAVERYRRDLQEHPELLARLAAMMGLRDDAAAAAAAAEDEEDEADDEADDEEEAWPMARPDPRKPLYDRVCEQVWRYAAHYKLVDPTNPLGNWRTVWFVMDEFGAAFRHGPPAAANFKVAAFVYMPQGKLSGAVAYSLAWPVAAVAEGQECRRDYAVGLEAGSLARAARLATWLLPPAAVRRQMAEAHAAKAAELARIEKVHSHMFVLISGCWMHNAHIHALSTFVPPPPDMPGGGRHRRRLAPAAIVGRTLQPNLPSPGAQAQDLLRQRAGKEAQARLCQHSALYLSLIDRLAWDATGDRQLDAARVRPRRVTSRGRHCLGAYMRACIHRCMHI